MSNQLTKRQAKSVSNVKYFMAQSEISINELSQRANILTPYLRAFLNLEMDATPEGLNSIAEVLDVKVQQIDGTQDPITSEQSILMQRAKSKPIPVLTNLAVKSPILDISNISGYINTPLEDLSLGINFWLKKVGDSMSPRIPDGAMMLVNRKAKLHDLDSIVVKLDNQLAVRSMSYCGMDNQIAIYPSNRDKNNGLKVLTASQKDLIIGRVMMLKYKI